MKPFGIGLLLLGASALGASPVVVQSVRGPVVTSDSPKAREDWPGTATVTVDLKGADLELKVWRVGDVYNLEALVDVKRVNQQILPVGTDGLASSEAALRGAPWIKITLPGLPTKTLDAVCVDKKKSCRGFWPAFPFDPQRETKIIVEVNLRGLEGRHWSLFVNRYPPGRSASRFSDTPVSLSGVHASQGFESAKFERRPVYSRAEGGGEVSAIEEWELSTSKKLAGVGWHRLGRRTAFEVLRGSAVFELIYEGGVESIELRAGDRLELPLNSVMGVLGRSSSPRRAARLRRLEYL